MTFIRLAHHAAFVAEVLALASANAVEQIHLVHSKPSGYSFFKHTIEFPSGEYYALQCTQTCELKKSQVSIRAQQIQTTEGPASGVVARSRKATPSLFMVRGLPGLKEGPVPTWYYNQRFQAGKPVSERPWTASQSRRYDIDGKPLTITGVYSSKADAGCTTDTDCPSSMRVDWKFRFGDVERTIAVAETTSPELGTPLLLEDAVVWIGDLDGDGKPDLVLRSQERRDYLELRLFLSQEIATGKPWKPAARFYFWDPRQYGC